jgi:hypothetical protein
MASGQGGSRVWAPFQLPSGASYARNRPEKGDFPVFSHAPNSELAIGMVSHGVSEVHSAPPLHPI